MPLQHWGGFSFMTICHKNSNGIKVEIPEIQINIETLI